MEPQINVTFVPSSSNDIIALYGNDRSNFPILSIRDYFADPEKALAGELQKSRHLLAFRFKATPTSPENVWYFIKTAEVAQKVLNAPRYGSQKAGHPWGEGPLTGVLRAGLAADTSPGAGTNNVMTAGADKHDELRKPLREELIKGLEHYIPRLQKCICRLLPDGSTLDINSFSRLVLQNAVLDITGLPTDAVAMDDISKLNALAHEMAKGTEGAAERLRALRNTIDARVVAGLGSVVEGTLFHALQKKGYNEIACRETIIALMIGARNGSTALTHLIWMLSRNPEMQSQYAQSPQRKTVLQNLFRHTLLTHSPVKTMNRNAINPMVLTITDNQGVQSFGILPCDKVDYLMHEAAKIQNLEYRDNIPLPHLPFGIGPNRCPASNLVEEIAIITAGMLMDKFQLSCDTEWLNVIPNVFTNEFVDEPIIVNLTKEINL